MRGTAPPSITDSELQREVEQELKWDPTLDAASVGVSAHERTVTLSGTVDHYASRFAAVRAAKRVRGVRAIADDIVVELAGTAGRTDHDIAEYAEHALQWNTEVPDTVRATVRDGLLTLDGTVTWDVQRRAAETAVRYVAGVLNINNNIEIAHATSAHDIHERIAAALRRSAFVDANNVHVMSDGGDVTLTGSVSSWDERERIRRTAWSAPGVTKLTDELTLT